MSNIFNNENIKYLNLTNQMKLEILNDLEKYIDDLNKNNSKSLNLIQNNHQRNIERIKQKIMDESVFLQRKLSLEVKDVKKMTKSIETNLIDRIENIDHNIDERLEIILDEKSFVKRLGNRMKSVARPIRRVSSGMFSSVKSRVSSLLSLRNNKQNDDDDDDDDIGIVYGNYSDEIK